MKKKLLFLILLGILLQASITPVIASTPEHSLEVTQEPDLSETYKMLFPNSYHYIEEYETLGIIDMSTEQIQQIFYDAKDFNEKHYELIVMNNRQIFTIISDITNEASLLKYRTATSTTITKDFQVGVLNSYNTFTVTYTINNPGYDKINSWKVSGDGFILYPTNKRFQSTENSQSPAYIMYNNVAMSNHETAILYDIGVAVGKNNAKAIIKTASGLDAWLWYFINAFI